MPKDTPIHKKSGSCFLHKRNKSIIPSMIGRIYVCGPDGQFGFK